MKPYKHFRWLLMWLMGVFIPVFGLQGALLTALDKTDFWGPLSWSYATHALLTLGIGWGILRGHQKVPDLIGFLFMGGSLLKFAAYFLLFKPFCFGRALRPRLVIFSLWNSLRLRPHLGNHLRSPALGNQSTLNF